jgi:hypothetical protein
MKLLTPIKLDNEKTKNKRKRRKTIRRNNFLNKIIKKRNLGENKKNRDKKIKRRKNFFPSLILTILLWLASFYIIYFVDPLDRGAVQLFFSSIFLSLLFTLSLVFFNTRRGLLFTIPVIIYLILRYFGIGNIINFLLILGLTITAEIYFSKK